VRREVQIQRVGATVGKFRQNGDALAADLELAHGSRKLKIDVFLQDPGVVGRIRDHLVLIVHLGRDHDEGHDRQQNQHADGNREHDLHQGETVLAARMFGGRHEWKRGSGR